MKFSGDIEVVSIIILSLMIYPLLMFIILPAILLGYPVMGVWFWCTDQSMVQSVLGAKNLKQGQLGANFIGWLKILDVPLFILPGIVCFVHCKNQR